MLVRNLAVAAGHHNESDGSEQARKTANDYDDKHDSPTRRNVRVPPLDRELGVLPVQNGTGYKSCRSIGGHTPKARGPRHAIECAISAHPSQ
jgi:hypothetical protein